MKIISYLHRAIFGGYEAHCACKDCPTCKKKKRDKAMQNHLKSKEERYDLHNTRKS